MQKKGIADKKDLKQKSSGGDDSKVFAFLAVFLTIIGFLIAFLAKKNDKYVMFYAKQSLVLFIAMAIVWAASFVLLFVPIIGWIALCVAYVILIVLWVIGWIYALSGKMKPLPLIGKYASKFDF